MSADLIIPFDGSHASIPAGWSRYTALDGKYPKIHDLDIGGTGGSSSHTHTVASHNHSWSSSHTHTTGNIEGNVAAIKTDGRHQDAPPWSVAKTDHHHSGVTSGTPTNTSVSSNGATSGSANNEYSRYHFIFLSGSSSLPFPTNSVVMRNDTDNRANSSHFNAMNGRYMKGAGTGADAGSGTDVTTHTHSQSHSHTLSHKHANDTSGNIPWGMIGGKNIPASTVENHSHTIYFSQHNENSTNSSNIAAGTDTLKYREMHFWKVSSQTTSQIDDIVMCDGEVPNGWEDLGYSDVYIRGKTQGEALTTGGSYSHTHSNLSHSHSGNNHTHSITTSTKSADNKAYRNGGSDHLAGAHSHTGTTSSTSNANTGSYSASISSENTEPEYVKIKLIQKQFSSGGGSFLLNLI